MSQNKIAPTLTFDLPEEFGGVATADYVQTDRGYTVMFPGKGVITRTKMPVEKAISALNMLENGNPKGAVAILAPIF